MLAEANGRLEQRLRQFRQPGAPAALRLAAAEAMLHLATHEGGADGCLAAAVQLCAAEKSPHVQ